MASYNFYLNQFKQFKPNAKNKIIIDTIGIHEGYWWGNEIKLKNAKIMGIEAKASYNDFLNGFCCHCEYTYIIAPVGIIPIKKLPPKIGLIEIDLKNYSITDATKGFIFKGIKIAKQCQSRKSEIYKTDIQYKVFYVSVINKIARQHTTRNIYKKNEIKIEDLNN